MKYCSRCGGGLEPNARYCPICGASVQAPRSGLKKTWLIVSLLVVLLLSGAYLSNPSPEDFEKFAAGKVESIIEDYSSSRYINWALNRAAQYGLRQVTERHDYVFFSIYHVDLPGDDLDLILLGVFGFFLPLKGI